MHACMHDAYSYCNKTIEQNITTTILITFFSVYITCSFAYYLSSQAEFLKKMPKSAQDERYAAI